MNFKSNPKEAVKAIRRVVSPQWPFLRKKKEKKKKRKIRDVDSD
jgi:hypothetical protein